LVLIGITLGLPVSKHLFGVFWRWKPREIGALCAAAWLVAQVALLRYGRLRNRGLMLMALGGNAVISLAWFGAGIAAYHLRMHGHGATTFWPLAIFLGVNACFLLAALSASPDPTETLDTRD
jgi:hypothetical protein